MYIDHLDRYYFGVLPAYKAFVEASGLNEGNSKLKSTATHACNELYHFREKLVHLYPKDTFGGKLVGKREGFEDYELLGDVFNSTKHNPHHPPGKLLANGWAVIETIVSTVFPDPVGESYIVSHVRIMVHPISGKPRDLMDICTNIMNAWTKLLTDEGRITSPIYYTYTGDALVTPEQKAVWPQVSLYATQGRPFNFGRIGRLYNYETNSFTEMSVE